MKLPKLEKATLNALPLVAIVGVACLAYQRSQSSQAAQSKAISAPTTYHQVQRVTDGDTIVLENGEKVRFCGIDAPESSQPLGSESTANLKKLIDAAGGEVIVAEHDRDRYGRIVAEVFTSVPNSQEEKLLNYEQVRAGLAYEYKQYSGKCMNGSVLRNGEKLAQSERKGVWNGGNYQKPWDYRKQKRES